MVAYNQNGFIKSNYRKFNIRFDLEENKNKVDDYYMMKEMLTRRFSNSKFQDELDLPSLLLIDGGKGQYNSAKKVLDNLKIDIPIISMAKGEERDAGREILIHDKFTHRLNENNPLLHFLQNIRDEVHRFVIGAHRQKRSKSLMSTRLDEITGLGGIRRKNLLMRFGSTKEVSKASVNELQKVQGISRNLAEQIYNFFNTND